MALQFTLKAVPAFPQAAMIIPTGGAQGSIGGNGVAGVMELAEGAALNTQRAINNLDNRSVSTGMFYMSPQNEPNILQWNAGNWDVSLWIKARSFNVFWRRVRVSRIDAGGTVIAEHNIATTDFASHPNYDEVNDGLRMDPGNTLYTSVAFAGTESNNTSVFASTGGEAKASDRVYITFEFYSNYSSSPLRKITIRSDAAGNPFVKINTPLVVGGGGPQLVAHDRASATATALDVTAKLPRSYDVLDAVVGMTAQDVTTIRPRSVSVDQAVATAVAQPVIPEIDIPATDPDVLQAVAVAAAQDVTTIRNRSVNVDQAVCTAVAKDASANTGGATFRIRDAFGNWVTVGGQETV